jgi:hypothetical protein
MSEKVIRPTIIELWRGIQEAKRKFPVGTEWQHYGGSVYEITGHGVDEETGEPEVRYVAARQLEDSRCVTSAASTSVTSPRTSPARSSFTASLSKMASEGTQGPRFRRVYRTESFETIHGREITRG